MLSPRDRFVMTHKLGRKYQSAAEMGIHRERSGNAGSKLGQQFSEKIRLLCLPLKKLWLHTLFKQL